MTNPFKNLFGFTRAKQEQEISRLYNLYKDYIINYLVKNNSLDREDAEIIYQDSFMVLYEKIQKGEITEPAVIKKFLFRTAYHKMLHDFRDKKNTPFVYPEEFPDPEETDESDRIEMGETAWKVIAEMEEACKKVLTLFYVDKKSMEEIAGEMAYASHSVAKNKKHSCLNILKKRVIEAFKKEGLI